MINLNRLVMISLLLNKGLKVQGDCQTWPMIVSMVN